MTAVPPKSTDYTAADQLANRPDMIPPLPSIQAWLVLPLRMKIAEPVRTGGGKQRKRGRLPNLDTEGNRKGP